MKAAIYQGIDDMIVQDIGIPDIGPNDVLIKVESCAVCGSDIRIFHHGNSRVRPPQILGHEIAGVVVGKGADVRKFETGDRVAVGADVPCGHCFYCESGLGNNCRENHAMGYQFAGGFAQYCLLNEMAVNYGPVHVMPDCIDFDSAALAEPLACVINGLELVDIKLGDTLAVIGAGPIGCMMIPMARLYGAAKIIVIEKDKQRIDKARDIGADICIWTEGKDPVEEVLRETEGMGADVVITANAVPETHIQAIDMAGHRARVNLFGGLAAGSTIAIDPNKIHYKEMSVCGSHGSTPRQHRLALDLIAAGKINMEGFISHRFPLDNITEAFKAAEGRLGMRVIVKPWEEQ